MSETAKVYSVDAIRIFRSALIKFAEVGNVALASGDSDVDGTLVWLERDQTTYWAGQLRKRQELVVRCEEAVRQKKIFKGPDGSQQSVVDEMRALALAKRSREEAEQKTIAVKKAIGVLRKESLMHKGRMQRLGSVLQVDLPRAVRQLDSLLDHLSNYLAVQSDGVGIPMIDTSGPTMASPGAKRIGYESLRDLPPGEEERRSSTRRTVDRGEEIFQPWPCGSLQPWQLEAIEKLSINGQPMDPDQQIIMAAGAWKAKKIYLERKPAVFEADSGWVLGPADPLKPADPQQLPIEYESFRAGDIVAARPDLARLLSLPEGFLVVLDGGGIVAMMDGAGLDVWAVALLTSEA